MKVETLVIIIVFIGVMSVGPRSQSVVRMPSGTAPHLFSNTAVIHTYRIESDFLTFGSSVA